jgi:hypothetical protein
MTEAQENELAGMITDVAISYANGHAVDFRIAAKAAVAFVIDATRTDARVVPVDVCAALARMCKPLDESRLSGVTAEEDARCMVLISGYVLAGYSAAPTDAQIDAATAAWFHYSQEYANDVYRARMRAAIAASAIQPNKEPK